MIAALAITVAAGLAGAWLWYKLRQSWLLVLLWRWFSGHGLDGQHRTNATWTRRSHGDRPVLHPTGHAVRWHHWPRLHRAGIRTSSTFGFFLLLYGLVAATMITLSVLAAVALGCLYLAAWRIWRAARNWTHHRRWVRPLSHALTPVLAGPPPRLEIEPDRSRVKIWLPEEFTGDERDKQGILQAVTAKLAIEAPDPVWKLDHAKGEEGRKPVVILTKSIPPPPRVRPPDIRGDIDAAAEHEVILGLGKKRQLIKVSLDTETPHIGLCMGTGDGKSTAAMNIATQILYHGGLVVFLDYKLMSHMWARGLPNVAYAGTPAEIHEMLLWLANDDEQESELTRRKKVALASADIRGNVTADLGPRILIVAEELNATQKRLKAYWRKLGGKGPSPAAEALDEIHFTGRQLRCHALDIAQRLSAKAAGSDGSADSRENIGTILFSNPSASTWKMLCDGHAQPSASDHKGRYQVVTRKQVREMQGAWWDEEDARDFATAGKVALPRSDMPLVTRGGYVPAVPGAALVLHEGSEQPKLLGDTPFVPPSGVTLREAVEAGLVSRTVAGARKASQRPGFPEPVGRRDGAHIYDLGDLYAYQSQKVRITR